MVARFEGVPLGVYRAGLEPMGSLPKLLDTGLQPWKMGRRGLRTRKDQFLVPGASQGAWLLRLRCGDTQGWARRWNSVRFVQ